MYRSLKFITFTFVLAVTSVAFASEGGPSNNSITIKCNSEEMPVPVTVKTNSAESSTVVQCAPALCMVRALHTVPRSAEEEGVRHISVYRTAGANKEELVRFNSRDVMEGMSRAKEFVKEGKCTDARLLPDEI